MQLTFIRHGSTEGNLRGAYIGVTDQPLCSQGRESLLALRSCGVYPSVQAVISSPLLRCLETAKLLYPGLTSQVFHGLRECSFGAFENASYEELKDVPSYRAWLDSGGEEPPPYGENQKAFSARCLTAYMEAVTVLEGNGIQNAAFVVHGGVIMAVLERWASPVGSFYQWQVKNGNGYTATRRPDSLFLDNPTILWKEHSTNHL